jgi:hypothetical protein
VANYKKNFLSALLSGHYPKFKSSLRDTEGFTFQQIDYCGSNSGWPGIRPATALFHLAKI